MDLSIDTSELDALAADLAVEAVRVGAKTAASVRKAADVVKTTGKRFVPRLTGALGDSITTDLEGDGRSAEMAAFIGPTEDYGRYVEYGTSVMAPQPYMGPGFEAGERVLNDGAEKVADEVLE